jgi:hypothetical protein
MELPALNGISYALTPNPLPAPEEIMHKRRQVANKDPATEPAQTRILRLDVLTRGRDRSKHQNQNYPFNRPTMGLHISMPLLRSYYTSIDITIRKHQ